MEMSTLGVLGYLDVYAVSGIEAGTSVLLTNKGQHVVYVYQSESAPEDGGYPLHPEMTTLVQGHTGLGVWVKGGVSPVFVQALINTIMPFTAVDLPHYLYTSDKERYRRIRVDLAQTGFFEGREFRTFYEFNIAAGASIYLRVQNTVDVILHELVTSLDEGALRITPFVGGTPGGSFSTPLPVLPKNTMTGRPTPIYTSSTTISTGGTLSGGTALDVVRLFAASATAQRQSVGGSVSSERGIAAGTYYYQLQNIGTGAATGVFSGWWEERPLPNF